MSQVRNMEKTEKPGIITKLKNMGPAAIVAATIIGPGTVTTCSLAGVSFQYALGWAILFAVIATSVLQLMTSRLGIITGKGLAEVIREIYKDSWIKVPLAVIVVFAIGMGNSAYQSGNMIGASMGLGTIFNLPLIFWNICISIIVFALLWTCKYKVLEKFMIALVFVMVILFVFTAIIVKPDLGAMLKGLLIPSIPAGSILITMGVIGTTIVPHCLYYHSALTAIKWNGIDKKEALKNNNFDVIFNIVLAGVISYAIIITGAAMFGLGIKVSSGADLAKQLAPLAGSWSKYFFGAGLFAAGITSSIAAPMSAALAISGIMGWSTDLKETKNRVVWILVLAAGFLVTATGYSPIKVIVAAQAFNGILLPISTIILLIVMNNKKSLGDYTNNTRQNILGVAIVLITIILGAKTLWSVISRFI